MPSSQKPAPIPRRIIDEVRHDRNNPGFFEREQAEIDPELVDFIAADSARILAEGPLTKEKLIQFGDTLLAITRRSAEVANLEAAFETGSV